MKEVLTLEKQVEASVKRPENLSLISGSPKVTVLLTPDTCKPIHAPTYPLHTQLIKGNTFIHI